MDLVIAHTRTFNIFHLYAGRISLHHAHLAHALGKKERALECYRVAGKVMAGDGELVGVMAQAGEISIRLADVLARKEVQCESGTMEGRSEKVKGKKRARNEEMEENEDVAATLEWELEELHEMAKGVIGRCRGMGATPQAIGHILEACFSPEILKAKYAPLHHSRLTACSVTEKFFAIQVSSESCVITGDKLARQPSSGTYIGVYSVAVYVYCR